MISPRLFPCAPTDADVVATTAMGFAYVVLEDGRQPSYDERAGGVRYVIDDGLLGRGDSVGLADMALRRALQTAVSRHTVVEAPVGLRR